MVGTGSWKLTGYHFIRQLIFLLDIQVSVVCCLKSVLLLLWEFCEIWTPLEIHDEAIFFGSLRNKIGNASL
jgi:hypothetical protein